MDNQNFTTTLLTDQTPQQVFDIVKDVRKWWTGYYSEEIKGSSDILNEEFTFRAGGGAHYTKQKLVELVPDKKLVWLVTECELSFIENKEEWTGTKIIFSISKNKNKTQVTFTHEGLVPDGECYDSCAPAWAQYLQNRLLPLISTGKGGAT